ncbi:unnamed protein product [Sphagnum compactum]
MQSFGNGCGFKYQLTRLNPPGCWSEDRGKLEVRLLGSGQEEGRWLWAGVLYRWWWWVKDAGPVAEQIRFRSPSHVLLGRGLFEDRVLRLLKV